MTNAIIMQLITVVTNGDRLCYSFVYDNQSTWKNFDSFSSEHESIRSEHKSIRSVGQWCGVEVWQRQPRI
ncbi:MAG: hypothetical protein V7L22_24480 [Nostoc sp.]|uniref:hypothetical protein n=1 Tax=Nostoc sp. TaxID=1180 RepID=UPI002FF81A37